MAIARVPYLVKAGSTKFGILEPEIYTYIESTVGLTKGDANTTYDFKTTAREMRRNGIVMQLAARTNDGMTHHILCQVSKVASAMTALIGLKIAQPSALSGGVSIVSVTIPRKRSRY